MNLRIIVATKNVDRTIILNYVQQDDGTWISKMENETMQDIKQFYPEVLENE